MLASANTPEASLARLGRQVQGLLKRLRFFGGPLAVEPKPEGKRPCLAPGPKPLEEKLSLCVERYLLKVLALIAR